MLSKTITLDSLVRGILTVAILVILFLGLQRLSSVLIPFFLAVFLAYYMFPLVEWFQAKTRRNTLSVFLAFFTVILGAIGLSLLILPLVSQEITNFRPQLKAFAESESIQALESFPVLAQEYLDAWRSSADWNTLLSQLDFGAISGQLADKSSLFINSVFGVFAVLFGLFLMILYLVFILMDYNQFFSKWPYYIPKKYRYKTILFFKSFREGMNGYFRAQAKVAVIVGILFSIGFSLISLPLAILMGVFTGLLNMVPYLQTFALVPAVVLALIQSETTDASFLFCLALVVLVFAVVQLIQEALLVPKFMGNITTLNPAIILLSLSIWGSLLGIIGMIIAIPFTNILVSYYKSFISRVR